MIQIAHLPPVGVNDRRVDGVAVHVVSLTCLRRCSLIPLALPKELYWGGGLLEYKVPIRDMPALSNGGRQNKMLTRLVDGVKRCQKRRIRRKQKKRRVEIEK